MRCGNAGEDATNIVRFDISEYDRLDPALRKMLRMAPVPIDPVSFYRAYLENRANMYVFQGEFDRWLKREYPDYDPTDLVNRE